MKSKVFLISLVLIVVVLSSGVLVAKKNLPPSPSPGPQKSTSVKADCSKPSSIFGAFQPGSGYKSPSKAVSGLVYENGSVNVREDSGCRYLGSPAGTSACGTVDYSGTKAVSADVGDFNLQKKKLNNAPLYEEGNICVLTKKNNVLCKNETSVPPRAQFDYLYSGGDATKVEVGGGHACYLKQNGNLECFGNNASGQAKDITTGKVLDFSLSGDSTCVLKDTTGSFLRGLFYPGTEVDCYGKGGYGVMGTYSPGIGETRISEVEHSSDRVCMKFNSGNVRCEGQPGYNATLDYNKGDAKEIFTSNGAVCILKNDNKGNGGNVNCWGCTSSDCIPPISNKFSYTKGDAIDVAVSNAKKATFGAGTYRFQCILDEEKDVKCFDNGGTKNAAANYSCNLAPEFNSYSFNSTKLSNNKFKINTSINWDDPDNNFSESTLEHNFSGSPQNTSVSKNSHFFSKTIDPGVYYIKFYGEDGASLTNTTGKMIFEKKIKSGPSSKSSFHWEDTSGNEIPSVSITDSKNVTMVANYSSQDPAASNTVSFDVYGDGNFLTTKSGVSVQSIGGSDYAEKEVNITSSWAASYQGLHFNVTGNKSSDLGLKCKNCGSRGGQTCPVSKTNISCVSSNSCSNKGGSVMSESCRSGVCCNKSASSGGISKDFCEKNSNSLKFCNDYENKSRCESNTCGLPPVNSSGCEGNCGCWWNSTGKGPKQGSCLGFVNGSETKGMPDDGLCLQISNSSDTCEDDGVLQTSWEVNWRNVSSGETYMKQSKIPSSCQPGSRTTTCPSVAKLPGENDFTIPLTILALTLAYVFYWNRREE